MKSYLLSIVLCATFAFGQNQTDVLTTDAVIKMVQAGVPSQTIIRTIATADRVNFTFLPSDLELLGRAKVPEDVFKAMAAKAAGRPIPGAAVPVAPPPTEVASPQRPVNPPRVTRVHRDDDGDLRLSRVELRAFGGANGGSDRSPFAGASYSVGGEIAVGLLRYLALTGTYAYDNIGAEDVLSCPIIGGRIVCSSVHITQNAHEFMGGGRVPFPNRSVVTPYVQTSIGGVHVVSSASSNLNQLRAECVGNQIRGCARWRFRFQDCTAFRYGSGSARNQGDGCRMAVPRNSRSLF
jgi:hypothetical protein